MNKDDMLGSRSMMCLFRDEARRLDRSIKLLLFPSQQRRQTQHSNHTARLQNLTAKQDYSSDGLSTFDDRT